MLPANDCACCTPVIIRAADTVPVDHPRGGPQLCNRSRSPVLSGLLG
jgi:hypothetical protein